MRALRVMNIRFEFPGTKKIARGLTESPARARRSERRSGVCGWEKIDQFLVWVFTYDRTRGKCSCLGDEKLKKDLFFVFRSEESRETGRNASQAKKSLNWPSSSVVSIGERQVGLSVFINRCRRTRGRIGRSRGVPSRRAPDVRCRGPKNH